MNIITALRLPEPRPYTPSFSVAQEGEYWIVSDRDNAIAVVKDHRDIGGALLEVFTFDPRVPAEPVALPAFNHYATRIGYGASFGWSVDYMFQPPDRGTLTLEEASIARIVFRHVGEYDNGAHFSAVLSISYDAETGQYAYNFTWDIAETRDVTGEMSNLFSAKLMHSNMEKRRFDYGTFLRADGRWQRYPINYLVTGWQQYRLCNVALAPGGGGGHLSRRGIVPMLIHRQADVPLLLGSCNSCYDLHNTAQVRANVPAHVESRFLDAGPLLAARPALLSEVDYDDVEAYRLHMGELCDFTKTIRAHEPWSGAVWNCPDPAKAMLVEDMAHSGTRCLRLAAGAGEKVDFLPDGAPFSFDYNTEYVVSAWVKVEGDADVKAQLKLSGFTCTESDFTTAGAITLHGTRDWAHLTTRITTGTSCDYGYLHLKLKGAGQAWFDEILVEPVAK